VEAEPSPAGTRSDLCLVTASGASPILPRDMPASSLRVSSALLVALCLSCSGRPAPAPPRPTGLVQSRPSPTTTALAVVCSAEKRSHVAAERLPTVRLAGALWWAQELADDPDARQLGKRLRGVDREQAAAMLADEVRKAGAGDCALLSLFSLARAPAAPESPPMVLIDGGPFLMGCDPTQQPLCPDDAQPLHEVVLPPFEVDIHEVAADDYTLCVEVGGCQDPAGCSGADCGPVDGDAARHSRAPATYVTWEMAETYCRSRGGGLPTEAQWEKAARGTDGRPYPWGNEEPTCDRAWFEACGPTPDTYPHERDVDDTSRPPSPYGAFDMAGNMAEWTSDWYAADAYRRAGGSPPPGIGRVVRGGSWTSRARRGDLLTYHRDSIDPTLGSPTVGFRCARLVLPAAG